MNLAKSQNAFERARKSIPGGVNSPARAFGAVGGTPPFIDRANGAFLVDIDGNRYLDYIGSWGPMILGHRHPEVIDAIEKATGRGTSFGAPTVAETVLAEMIIDAVDSIEKVRLVNSGTEATASAIRLARGFTGRDLIVKFAGNYHGHVDSLLVSAGSAAATLGVADSPGITSGTASDTIVLPYNDVDSLIRAFEAHGSQIAAVILEPVVGNMGCVPGSERFLATARLLTDEYRTVLIFDEVMTGFRVAYGGAQSVYNIRPDLTTLGKVIGGGLPVGAYGGRADIMNHILPVGKVFQAGTLSGNPLATAAGIATLDILKRTDPYPKLEEISEKLAHGLDQVARASGISTTLARVGSMMTLFFNPLPVSDWAVAARCDTKKYARFFHGMLRRGIYLPCSQYEAMFVSAAHAGPDIEATIEAARETFAEMG
jgi:glutamate-1-semialdehyde 2,1-aminomutase